MFKDNYSSLLKSDFLDLYLKDISKDEIINELQIEEKDYSMLTLILKLRSKSNLDKIEGEEWRTLDFLGFPYYSVSNLGRVSRMGKVKSLVDAKSGYKKVNLYHLNKVKTFAVHRLVMLAFVENIDNKPTVNHIDGNRQNNRLDNLEYADHKEQSYHRDHIGPSKGKSSIRISGSNNPMSKLTDDVVLSIYNENKELSHREVATKYNVDYERVRLIRKGEVWKHLTQGSTTSRKA